MGKYIDAERLKAEIERRNLSNRYITTEGYEEELYEIIDSLQQEQHSLPDNLDEAAREIVIKMHPCLKDCIILGDRLTRGELMALVKAGAEWMAGQGWIDDGSMPPETKQESDTLQGHREWTESERVLAWDSMYGCCVDWTRNGKWMSEQTGGYTGQVCHGIIAWRPIPEYKEKQYTGESLKEKEDD